MKACRFIILLMVLCNTSFAQDETRRLTLSAGTYAGIMNGLTDIGTGGASSPFIRQLSLKGARPATGMYAQLQYRELVSLFLSMKHGSIAAADRTSANQSDASRALRNLSFRSPVTELAARTGVSVFCSRWYGEDGIHRFSISITGGFSLFRFNPRASLDGKWHRLRDYRLEGQGFAEQPGSRPYPWVEKALPFSIQADRELTNGMKLGLECSYRLTFTDYLDDVSGTYIDPALFDMYFAPAKAAIARQLQYRGTGTLSAVPVGQPRGNAKKNDAWFSIMLKLGVIL